MRWMRPAAVRWLYSLFVTAHARTNARSGARTNATSRLVFGSCSKTNLPQPLWPYVRARNPKAWIWAGDAIYGDRMVRALPLTFEALGPQYLRDVYEKQNAIPEYARLREEVPYFLGTWDDHDFGLNDGMISVSRGAAAPSRHRRASSLGAVRTASRDREAASPRWRRGESTRAVVAATASSRGRVRAGFTRLGVSKRL